MSSCCTACVVSLLLFLIVESSPAADATTTTTTNSTLIPAAVEVTSEPSPEVPAVTAEKPSSLQKRHTYRSNRNSVDVKKNRRGGCRKRRGGGCRKERRGGRGSGGAKKTCRRREKKCRNRMDDKCRYHPGCSRRVNKKCKNKYLKCISPPPDVNHVPKRTRTPKPHLTPNDPYFYTPRPGRKRKHHKTLAAEKEPCKVTSDCQSGLCCAQHGPERRLCKSFTKKDQICTRRFDRKRRSAETYERCPCEFGLSCKPDAQLEHHYTCQGAT